MKKIIFAFALFCLTSCIYGPSVEHKSPLNALNGENYQTAQSETPSTLLVPFAEKKERTTKIEGQLIIQEDMSLGTPLRYISLDLLNSKGESVQKVSTLNDGHFTFSGVFQNGSYTIKVDSKKYSGEFKLEVRSYSIEKIIIQAKTIH